MEELSRHEAQEGNRQVPGDVLKVLGAVDLKLIAQLLSNVYKTESVSRISIKLQ